MNRRVFLQGAAAVAAASAAKPSWALGANDRIRVAIIGTGIRGNEILTSWLTHADTAVVALCDVAKDRLEKPVATLAAAGQKADTYGDYRRILDRKDVDAVVVATPDHWHGPMTVEACQAGKDVYVEKPVAHQIAPMFQMLDAARKHERVVQVGLQQRAWPHFQEAARAFREIGPTNHVVMAPPGGGPPTQAPPSNDPEAPPATLDWEMFQGPAPRKAFAPLRLRWRGFYDYGGGNISDWGVHLVDVMNWFLGLDQTLPLVVQGSAQYVRIPKDPERVPDTYAVTMQYDRMLATLSNAAVFGPAGEPLWGNYFFGDRSLMLVNRDGYEVRPRPTPRPADGTPPPSPAPATATKFGFGEEPILKMTDVTSAHVRDFLDCMRSRKRPLADIAIGVNSTLPTLLAVESIKAGGRAMRWDAAARKAVAL
jgi:predicted dehydrogenase